MRASDVMTTQVVTVLPDTSVREVARTLLINRISAVPVVDKQGRILGMLSEGDFMRRAETGTDEHHSWWLALVADLRVDAFVKSHGLHAKDVMTREIVSVSEDASLDEVATLLERHRIKRVPVVSGGKLVGIVSRANLLHGLVAQRAGTAPSGWRPGDSSRDHGYTDKDRDSAAFPERRGLQWRCLPLGCHPIRA